MRRIKKKIDELDHDAAACLAILAAREKIRQFDLGDEIFERVIVDYIHMSHLAQEGDFTHVGEYINYLDDICLSKCWHTVEDFMVQFEVRKSEGPPYYKAKRQLVERLRRYGIPIGGFL